jgi:hypothetical protein
VTSDTKSVEIVFGEGDDGLRREVKVVHQRFPNGGEWSFFLCPVCERPARVLKLHEKQMCRRCCLREGIGYRVSSGTAVERVNGAWIFLRSGAGKFPSWRIGDQP